MDDPFDRFSEQEIADTCALADGTLPAARRAEVEALVRSAPELTALLERQRRALAATAALAAEPVPDSLRYAVDGLRPRTAPRRRRRVGWILSAAGVIAAVLVVVVALNVSGGFGRPSVAAAADFALRPATGPAPAAVDDTGRLDASVGGVSFPDYAAASGWRASGVRTGKIGGRPATVVYYEKGGQTVGYAIVDGAALPRPGGAESTTRSGVQYLTLTRQGRQVVTWESGGHTCVLTGPVPADQLLTLAARSGTY